MQLLSTTIRCLSRSQTMHLCLQSQAHRIHLMTPICVQQNFLQNIFERHRLGARKSLTFSPLLLQSFHTQNAQYFRYSKILEGSSKPDTKEKSSPTDAANNESITSILEESQKLGLFQRFKKMAKDYWYVLIPVHVVTSACWLGAFYYTSTSGVDIVGILEKYNFSETIISPLRNSSLGHIAVAYFLYKIATPARYFVTVAGTTMTIKQGMKFGWIKPMPSREEMKQMYQDKKDEMQQKIQDKRDEVQQKYENRKQAIRDKYMRK